MGGGRTPRMTIVAFYGGGVSDGGGGDDGEKSFWL